MSKNITAPFKNHNHIVKVAQNFLRMYHPNGSYPTPIEEIVEFKLKVDIIPIPGLHKAFDIDGFLSSDRKSISVDEGVYENRPGRYRFTLAHEIGHFILHKDIYEQYKFKKIEEWRRFIENFPEKEYSWFEWQAYEFAGLILVPCTHLAKRLKYHIKKIKTLGIQLEEIIQDRVIELLAKDFVVSREVVQRRLLRDNDEIGTINGIISSRCSVG